MASTFYKYAERDADSQINWSEVSKGLTDMLAETNKVREDKKTALDTAQRETMDYLAQTPNGEDASARTAALEYADQASNRMRIAKQQMEQGQMSVKDYTVFRQNLTDNTNLLFNANKAYQEEYAVKMQRSRDGISSALEPDRMKDAEMFGNWSDTGFYIGPDGTVMAGKMTDKDVDGKKVRTLDQTPGNLRNISTINQLIVGKIDKYDYETKVNSFVDALGKNIETTTVLGKIGAQGLSRTVDDITKRTDIIEGDKKILYNFVQSENDKIKEIAGTDFDKARLLMDSARIAPNGQPYTLTSDPKEAAKGENFILKEYDPSTRGIAYKISKSQSTDAEEFIRSQMRAKYNKIEKEDVVGQLQLQETAEQKEAAAAKYRKKTDSETTTTKSFTITPDVVSDSSQRAYKNIQSKLPTGFTAEDTGTRNPLNQSNSLNEVTVTAPNNKKYVVRTKLSGDNALFAIMGLEDFVIANNTQESGKVSTKTIKFDSQGNIIP